MRESSPSLVYIFFPQLYWLVCKCIRRAFDPCCALVSIPENWRCHLSYMDGLKDEWKYTENFKVDERILINLKHYSSNCNYKVKILSRNTWGRQGKPLYYTANFKAVASRPLDAEKLNTFREKSINNFVVLSFKVTHEWVKEKFYSRCFCNPVGLLYPKGCIELGYRLPTFLPCY